jgi:hypothetical protein
MYVMLLWHMSHLMALLRDWMQATHTCWYKWQHHALQYISWELYLFQWRCWCMYWCQYLGISMLSLLWVAIVTCITSDSEKCILKHCYTRRKLHHDTLLPLVSPLWLWMNTSTCFPTSRHGNSDSNMRASFVTLVCKHKYYTKLYFSQGLHIFFFSNYMAIKCCCCCYWKEKWLCAAT